MGGTQGGGGPAAARASALGWAGEGGAPAHRMPSALGETLQPLWASLSRGVTAGGKMVLRRRLEALSVFQWVLTFLFFGT